MIYFVTATLGGEGYLNFMGNEFGHPEWIDFPGQHNDWSYKYARRQWSLAQNETLRYEQLLLFNRDMLTLIKENKLLQGEAAQINMDTQNNVMAFTKQGLVFVFCFHPHNAIPDYKLWVPEAGKYKVVFCSDDKTYGGHNRIDSEVEYFTNDEQQLSLYVTNRTAMALQQTSPK